MDNRTVVYLDDKGNEVPAELATKINIIEYDEKGNRVKETYMVAAKKEEPKKSFSKEDLEIDDSIITSIEWETKDSKIQDLLDRQKTK